jgi:hypothetical protein
MCLSRYEIARSAEKAYGHLELSGAMKVFLLNNQNELNTLIQTEGKNSEQSGVQWQVANNQLKFVRVYYLN